MCEYMEYTNNSNQPICKPYNSLCLFCVQGNSKRYNRIKEIEGYIEEFDDEETQ